MIVLFMAMKKTARSHKKDYIMPPYAIIPHKTKQSFYLSLSVRNIEGILYHK